MKLNSFSVYLLLSAALLASAAVFSCNNNAAEEKTTGKNDMMKDTSKPEMKMDTSSIPMVNHAEAILSGTYPDTAVDGSVSFHTTPDGSVIMTLDITVPAKAGRSVAIHIHEHGDCGDIAMMAHGHWNPTNAQHGGWGTANFHRGDIGNVKLNAKGKATLTLTTVLWTLGGTPGKNIIGKSIIVHGGMDDYTTQPTGNSGTRIGCGVIK
jgi:Cu-Zn family superoxide dismutase